MSSQTQPELKAKRTHARRSCDLCKVRKTRCELPDLDIASSSEPLPADKACHRCKVLALPCIVDDTSRKRGRRPVDDELGGSGRGSPSGAPRKARPRKSDQNGSATPLRGVNHDLDLMHAFHPSQDYTDDNGESSNARAPGAGLDSTTRPPYDPFMQAQIPSLNAAYPEAEPSRRHSGAGTSTEEIQETQEEAMKYHGRALELVCAMLKVAYGKTKMETGRKASKVVDIKAMLSSDMIVKLEGGLMQLKTLHPYMDPFAKECIGIENMTPSERLLLATTVYLCSLSLPPERAIVELRAQLAPCIEHQRDLVMLSQEQSFWAIQSLEVLALHAPLGILPLQAGNPRALSVARGHIVTARAISESLAFPTFAKVMVVVRERYNHFEESDYWLWACLNIQECSIALECESMHRPKYIAGLVADVEKFLDPGNDGIWLSALEKTDPATLIGRLSAIDRACRYGEVFDRLERLRGVLETAAQDVDFDPVGAMVEEMTSFGHRIDQLDQRHDHIMGMLAPSSGGIEAGWLGYRGLSRRAVMNKVHMIGMRYIIATAYLPGHPLSFPNLQATVGNALSTRLSYAIKKAQQPVDIMAFLQRSDAGVQAVWNFGVHRGNIAEQNLGAFVELESILLPGPIGSGVNAHIMPLHEIIAIVTECAKYLMEVEGAATLMRRSAKTANRPFKPPTWVYTMQQACGLLNRLGSISEQPEGAESIANGCSNILGSMIRITHEWMSASASGTPSGSADEPAAANLMEQQTGRAIAVAFADGQNGSGLPPPTIEDALRNLPPSAPDIHVVRGADEDHPLAIHNQQMLHAQVQQYMDTSDRWMAGDHHHPPPPPPPQHHYAGNGQGMGEYVEAYKSPGYTTQMAFQHHAQATNLDLLLSQMFNYSGPAGVNRGSHRAHENVPQGMGAGNEQFASETGGWSNAYE